MAGRTVCPDRRAVALDDGGTVSETLEPQTFDQFTGVHARARTYRLPAR